jgi:UDP-glucose 4-epimerase
MTTLVIGGCGFIGRHVVDALAASGEPVVIYDRHADASRDSDTVRQVRGDFSAAEDLDRTLARHRISRVVHLVSSTLPKSSNEDMRFDFHSNVMQSLALLDSCVRNGVAKIVYMSSGGTVYGIPRSTPMNETHPTEPTSSYGICKLTVEKYLALYQHLYGLSHVIVRAANPYGPGQDAARGQGVIAQFVRDLREGRPLQVWGDGTIVRDYFHVRDLAELVRRALLSDACGVFNAGSGSGTSINELISILTNVTGVRAEVLYKETRRFDVPAVVLDCAKAAACFNWRATVDLVDGISQYVSWFDGARAA